MPDLAVLWHWLEDSPLGTAVRESGSLFPVIETIHVLALTLVVGTIARLDLRLLGLASLGRPADQMARELLPWTWASFAVALLSGGLMFVSAAEKYAANWPFRIKLLCLLVAGVNMLMFQRGSGRRMGEWAWDIRPPGGARLAGGVSLVLWVGVVAAGRWIGYTVH